MIQWFRLVFYVKIFRKPEDDIPTEQDYLDAAAMIRSQAIDRQLEEDATWLRRETKIVLACQSFTSGKELLMRQMKVLYAEGYPKEERMSYTYYVKSTVRLLMHAIIDLIRDTGVTLSEELSRDFSTLLDEVETVDNSHITPGAVRAVQNIWSSKAFNTLYIRNFEIDFPPYAPYFAQEIPRIAQPDYVPSEADIFRLNSRMGGIKELRFTWDELDVHMFNVGSTPPSSFISRWYHQFENATALIWTVDVSIYDRPYLGQPTESEINADFLSFESWVNAPFFAKSSVILLLNNFTRMREKLPHSPLSTFFPDFDPESDDPATAARQYILKRFKDLNRNRLSIYSFWVDLDMSDNQHLYAALKKTLNHIQQRKARSEVWSASESAMGGSSPVQSRGRGLGSLGSLRRSASIKSPTKSGSLAVGSP